MQKTAEREALDLFLDAYAEATGEILTFVRESERPDFICAREDGTELGIELVRAMRSPEEAQWEEILDRREFRDPGEACVDVFAAVSEKGAKRATGTWQYATNTVLVVQVMDCPLSELRWLLEEDPPQTDLNAAGFAEIWVADFSELDAYPRAIELFGLYPSSCWGYYERWRGKPYD